jgi:hypothetical protein
MRKLTFPFLMSLVASASFNAQISCLPSGAVDVLTSAAPESPLFRIVEQKGRVPYKGKSCDDQSNSFDSFTPGGQFGILEFAPVTVTVQSYSEQGKVTFENIMQHAPPAELLKRKAQELKQETTEGFKRKVSLKDAPSGKIIVVSDRYTCTESKNPAYTLTSYYGYGISGRTIVNVEGNYYSADSTLAERIHKETVTNAIKAMQKR